MNENEVDDEAFWRFADPPSPAARQDSTTKNSRGPDRAFVIVLAAVLVAAMGALGYSLLLGNDEPVAVGEISQDLQAAAGLNQTEPAAAAPVEITAPDPDVPGSVFVVATPTPPPPPPTATPVPTATPEPTAVPEPDPAPTAVPVTQEPGGETVTTETSGEEVAAELPADDAAQDDEVSGGARANPNDAGAAPDDADGGETDETSETDGSDAAAEGSDTAEGSEGDADDGSSGEATDGGDTSDTTADGADSGESTSADAAPADTAVPEADLITIAAEMTAWINEVRAASGVASVSAHEGLASRSRVWSQIMGSEYGTILHCQDVERCDAVPMPADCPSWGENVAQGTSLDLIKGALLESPPHLQNILNPDFDHVGIGVVWLDGSWWITQSLGNC